MTDIQLKFNIEDKSSEEMKFSIMQNQIDALNESMGKVRRKLFAEVGVIKKMYVEIQLENEKLKKELSLLKNEKTQWIYCQDECLLQEA